MQALMKPEPKVHSLNELSADIKPDNRPAEYAFNFFSILAQLPVL